MFSRKSKKTLYLEEREMRNNLQFTQQQQSQDKLRNSGSQLFCPARVRLLRLNAIDDMGK